jgi:hypothetical protein
LQARVVFLLAVTADVYEAFVCGIAQTLGLVAAGRVPAVVAALV